MQGALCRPRQRNVERGARNALAIALQRRNEFIGHPAFAREVKLRHQRVMCCVTYAIVDVTRASRIFRRRYCRKTVPPLSIGFDARTQQAGGIVLFAACESAVVAIGVGVPDFNECAGEWLTAGSQNMSRNKQSIFPAATTRAQFHLLRCIAQVKRPQLITRCTAALLRGGGNGGD